MRKQIEPLKNHSCSGADFQGPLSRLPVDILSIPPFIQELPSNADFTVRNPFQMIQGPKQSTFTGSTGTDDAHDLPLVHSEIDALQYLNGSKFLMHIL